MITDNIVMWATLLGIVDWVYSKTQTLREILKTQKQPRRESFVFAAVEHLLPLVGCARSKRQCLTVPQNRKLFLWMLVCEWMEFLLSIYGMW